MSYNPEDTVWHLVSQTRLGRISILKNLDERTARETYKKLMPGEHPKEYIYSKSSMGGRWGSSRGYGPNDDWLEKIHIIGPEGIDLHPWFGVKPQVIDLRSYEEQNHVKTPEEIEHERLEELRKEVPSAFWLEPDFTISDHRERSDGVQQLANSVE